MPGSPKTPSFSSSMKAPSWTAYAVLSSSQAIFDVAEHRRHAPGWCILCRLDLMGRRSSLELSVSEAKAWIALYNVSYNVKQADRRISHTICNRCNF